MILMSQLILKKCQQTSEITEVKLVKDKSGFGFSIIGGTDGRNFIGNNGLYVSRVIEGGAAHADGRLSVGDKLINIRTKKIDKNLENTSQAEAVAILNDVDDYVVLKVMKFYTLDFDFSEKLQIPSSKSQTKSREGTLVSKTKLVQKPKPGEHRHN